MGTIKNLTRKFQALNTNALMDTAIDNTLKNLEDQNKEQLYAGRRKDGLLIGDSKPYQSAVYAFAKYEMNPAPGLGNPDLKVRGDFYEGFSFTRDGSETIKELSTDEKNDRLEAKYSPFGLGGEYKGVYINKFLRPEFNRLMEQATGLKLKPRGTIL